MGAFKEKLLIGIILGLYLLSIFPYTVHVNLNTPGVIKDIKIVNIKEIPEDLRNMITFNSKKCMILLVEDKIFNTKTVIITKEQPLRIGDIVEINDKILDWYVDWHEWNFFNESFNNIVVGDVQKIESVELIVENLLLLPIGNLIFTISYISFLIAPIFIVFIIYYLKKHFYLWYITLMLSLYSIEFLIYNYFANINNIEISFIQKCFGYIFILLIPLTIILLKNSLKDKRIYNYIFELLDELFK